MMADSFRLLQKQNEKLKPQIFHIEMARTKIALMLWTVVESNNLQNFCCLVYLLKMLVSYSGAIMKDMTDETPANH